LNTLQVDRYDLLDLGVGYVHESLHSFRVYARVDNVTDRRYATSVSLIGGQELLAPGAPRAYRAGIQFNF
jgi:outer membrane receptor protein involved in Fe transport